MSLSNFRNFATHLFKFVAYKSEGLEDGLCAASNGDDSLWAAPIADVDFGTTLDNYSVKGSSVHTTPPYILKE